MVSVKFKELKICVMCKELKLMAKHRRTCGTTCARKYRLLEHRQRAGLLNERD